jgi:hypothetical protein
MTTQSTSASYKFFIFAFFFYMQMNFGRPPRKFTNTLSPSLNFLPVVALLQIPKVIGNDLTELSERMIIHRSPAECAEFYVHHQTSN